MKFINFHVKFTAFGFMRMHFPQFSNEIHGIGNPGSEFHEISRKIHGMHIDLCRILYVHIYIYLHISYLILHIYILERYKYRTIHIYLNIFI